MDIRAGLDFMAYSPATGNYTQTFLMDPINIKDKGDFDASMPEPSPSTEHNVAIFQTSPTYRATSRSAKVPKNGPFTSNGSPAVAEPPINKAPSYIWSKNGTVLVGMWSKSAPNGARASGRRRRGRFWKTSPNRDIGTSSGWPPSTRTVPGAFLKIRKFSACPQVKTTVNRSDWFVIEINWRFV